VTESRHFDIRDFGAVGDGVHDGGPAIRTFRAVLAHYAESKRPPVRSGTRSSDGRNGGDEVSNLQSVAEAEPGAPQLRRSDEDDLRLREGVRPDPDYWTSDRLDLATRSWGPGWRVLPEEPGRSDRPPGERVRRRDTGEQERLDRLGSRGGLTGSVEERREPKGRVLRAVLTQNGPALEGTRAQRRTHAWACVSCRELTGRMTPESVSHAPFSVSRVTQVVQFTPPPATVPLPEGNGAARLEKGGCLLWRLSDVVKWGRETGRIERTDAMPKWEYKLIQWKWLVQYGGPHPADALAKNLDLNGLQGWRLDCQITLDVGFQQVEYGVFTREITDGAATSSASSPSTDAPEADRPVP